MALYDSMGGVAACRQLSEAFYTRVKRDPVLRPLFPGKTLHCAMEELSAWLVQFLDGGAPLFSPDNRWIAFTKKGPAPAKARDSSPAERLEQRFKGRMYDWMNVRFDGRGYLPDPRDPAATSPAELYLVAREGGAPKQLTTLGVDWRAVRSAC